MVPGIALIVGNGLTIDLLGRSGSALDSRSPFSLQFDVPFGSGESWQDAFPSLVDRRNEVRGSQPGITDFDVFNALLTSPHSLMLETRMREFLLFAYSSLQAEMDVLNKDATPWADWLRRHRSFLHAAVSFNYDLLLEDLLQRTGIITRSHKLQASGLTYNVDLDLWYAGLIRGHLSPLPLLLKPHGSIDYAPTPSFISMPPTTYPSPNVITMNDVPLIRIPRTQLGNPHTEAYIVLPTEYSPYENFQWVRYGYTEFLRRANSITHCVFLGLSYWESDREELDFLLDALPQTTEIIEANPKPCPLFRKRVESSARHYVQWKDTPLPITTGTT